MKLPISLLKLKNLPKFKLREYIPVVRFYVQEKSMLPTIAPDTIVLVENLTYKIFPPKKGEIIVFYSKKLKIYMIKRIHEIKKGGYFVKGDNPDFSKDSRHFGLIKKKDIIGKVFYQVKND